MSFWKDKSRWLGGLAILLAGCAPIGIAPERSSEYTLALNSWTRSARIYRGMETKLEVWAVYQSPDFRRHFVEEYSLAFGLSPEEREKMLKRELERAQEFEEFILVVHTTFSENNDLTAPDSTWRVNLIRDGIFVPGIELKRVWWKRDYINRFFPMVDYWSRTYVVSFPVGKLEEADRKSCLILEIAGPAGKVQMRWDLSG